MELDLNVNEPQTGGGRQAQEQEQEVIYVNEGGKDIEEVFNPDDADDEAAGVDAPTNIKSSYFSAKKVLHFLGLLAAVAVSGLMIRHFAHRLPAHHGFAGAAIASARNTNTKIRSDKMKVSGKAAKAKVATNDIFKCVFEPIMDFNFGNTCDDENVGGSTTTITSKDFDKELWDPYMKECEGFWSGVAYLFTRGVLYFFDYICGFAEFIGGIFNNIPDECQFSLPSGLPRLPGPDDAIVNDIVKNEDKLDALLSAAEDILSSTTREDVDSLLSGAEDCALALIDEAQQNMQNCGENDLDWSCIVQDILDLVLVRRRRRLFATGVPDAAKDKYGRIPKDLQREK